MSKPLQPSTPERRPAKQPPGAVQALVKFEKLTQIALVLPVAVLLGWALGWGLDRLLHRHWIYIVGIVLGTILGFVQLFRMIAEPQTLAGTAPDPGAPQGPGFTAEDELPLSEDQASRESR